MRKVAPVSKRETAFSDKYKAKLEGYAKAFRIEDLNDANDKSTLDIMLKTEIMIDDLQEQIQILIDENAVENAGNIKKLADLLRDATGTITNLQRTLAIDRRSRKVEEEASVADYLRSLKREAYEFMDKRIIKSYCPDCRVMVGRIYPVHDHTAFSVSFQCSQCKKLIRARREDRDVLFDVKDSHWRKKYRAEIIQPKKIKHMPIDMEGTDDDLVIEGDTEIITDELTFEENTIDDELEIIQGDDDAVAETTI